MLTLNLLQGLQPVLTLANLLSKLLLLGNGSVWVSELLLGLFHFLDALLLELALDSFERRPEFNQDAQSKVHVA
jgi:hypothetical protein